MSTLFFDHSGFEIRSRGNSLVLVRDGQTTCYPAQLVERVILQGSHVIHSSALSLLAGHGTSLLLLSGRQARHVATISGPLHNDSTLRLGQYRVVSNPEICAAWSARLLLLKLRNQRSTLHRILAERPSLRHHPFFQVLAQLRTAILNLAAACSSKGIVPAIAQLRGMEGAAARAYFSAYTVAFAPALGFVGRRRRPPPDPVNVCLSLAYTLLTHECEASAHSAGLDPALGFYHRTAFARPALACDLVEPLRADADFWVWSMFDRGLLRPEHFQNSGSICHLGKAGRSHFYLAYDEISNRARRHLRRHCALLARSIRASAPPYELDPDPNLDQQEFDEQSE